MTPPDYSVYRCENCTDEKRCDDCQQAALNHCGAWLNGLTRQTDEERKYRELVFITPAFGVLVGLCIVAYIRWSTN